MGLRPRRTTSVSHGRQPPLMLEYRLSESAASRWLHALVGLLHIHALSFLENTQRANVPTAKAAAADQPKPMKPQEAHPSRGLFIIASPTTFHRMLRPKSTR